jgi:tetrahydromethanopterin S-methyltransferase subunit G
MKKVIVLLFLFVGLSASAQEKVLPYTLEDREKLIRIEGKIETLESKIETLESKIENLEKRMEAGFSDIRQQINQLNTNIYSLFGSCIGLIAVLIAFMLWDRRSAMLPQTEATKALRAELDALKRELISKGVL